MAGNRSMTPDSLGRGPCDGDAAFVFALARDLQRQGMFAPYRPAFWGETGIESGEAVFGIEQVSRRWSSRRIHWQRGPDAWATTYSLAIPALRREAACRRLALDEEGLGGGGCIGAVRADTLFEGRQQGLISYLTALYSALPPANQPGVIPDCPKR